MDSPLVIAIVGAVGSIAAVFVTAFYASRSARRAQNQANTIEKTKVDAQAYSRARDSYDAALSTQARTIAELQHEMAEDREEYRRDITECKARIRELEQARRSDRERIQTLVVYMRVLIGILRTHDIEYPMPPAEMDGI